MTNLYALPSLTEQERRQELAERARQIADLAGQCLRLAKTLDEGPTATELRSLLFTAEHYAIVCATEMDDDNDP